MNSRTPGQQLMEQLEQDAKLSHRVGEKLEEVLGLTDRDDASRIHIINLGLIPTSDGPKTYTELARLVAAILAEEY